ncbi:MAG: chemotaxis protein CheR [Dehalococcoidia bacterium]|nr:MAG: chemotaxis protein CheR [Dehalococcoidia bacterium]
MLETALFPSLAPISDLEWAHFKRRILHLTGLDLSLYKREQMERRLKSRLQRCGVRTLSEYAALLASDPQHLQDFRDFITINVSEFYRDARPFTYLQERVLPLLLATSPRLRVWSAGCSIGAEPYTVTMLLDQLAPGGRHRVLATDLDATVLARARTGRGYTASEVRSLPSALRQRYLALREDGWEVVEPIRRMVEFRQHNLLADPFESGFDLILCRNVVIYFTDEAKDGLYRKFAQALRPGGVLFVGGTEVVTRAVDYGFEPIATSFYRRAA